MTTLYLIRHAEAEGNLYRRAHGHYDSAITDRGYRQIAALLRRFEGERIDAVYASDLLRARTTALALTMPRGLPLHTTPDLREVGIGAWEDLPWAYLSHFHREEMIRFARDSAHWNVSGGEDVAAVRERMLHALRRIAAVHPDGTAALVSHGMALRLLIGTLQGLTLAEIDRTGHAENTAVSKLEVEGDEIRVIFRDDASHLPDEITTLRRQTWTKQKDGVEEGIYFLPEPGQEGGFRVLSGEMPVGSVRVSLRGGAAQIDELRLDECARGCGCGIQLVGQAVSYARARGCDTLRAAVARNDALALRRAAQYGFRIADETPERVVLEKYIGYDPAYRIKRFDEAYRDAT